MPVLHLIAGPNGAGKTTFYERILAPVTRLPFVNADRIAAEKWPAEAEARSYDAAKVAAEKRALCLEEGRSFATETVFSHPSKLQLLRQASSAGFLVRVHVLIVPESLAVARVQRRVEQGGHSVPEDKIRQRFRRLWELVAKGVVLADEAEVRENSTASAPFREVARYRSGILLGEPDWPSWAPEELTAIR